MRAALLRIKKASISKPKSPRQVSYTNLKKRVSVSACRQRHTSLSPRPRRPVSGRRGQEHSANSHAQKPQRKSAHSARSLRQPCLITVPLLGWTPSTYSAATLPRSRKTARMRRTAETVQLRQLTCPARVRSQGLPCGRRSGARSEAPPPCAGENFRQQCQRGRLADCTGGPPVPSP